MKRTSLIILLFTIVLLCNTCKKAGVSQCRPTLLFPTTFGVAPTLKWISCDTGISTVYIYYATSQGNVMDSANAKDSLNTTRFAFPYNTTIYWYVRNANTTSDTFFFTTPNSPNPDQIVIGKYYVTVEYDSSGSRPGGPYYIDTILGHTTISIALVSPGLIMLTDDSISHMQVTESYNSAYLPSNGFLYGDLGDLYPPNQYASYIEFYGDSIYVQYGYHSCPICYHWHYWSGHKVH